MYYKLLLALQPAARKPPMSFPSVVEATTKTLRAFGLTYLLYLSEQKVPFERKSGLKEILVALR